jgi:hypothetical protein
LEWHDPNFAYPKKYASQLALSLQTVVATQPFIDGLSNMRMYHLNNPAHSDRSEVMLYLATRLLLENRDLFEMVV